MNELPIVKYEGLLWYFDARLNELRDYYTAEPRRLDSGGLEKEYFTDKITFQPIKIFDADRTKDDEDHVPHCLRDVDG
jgi:hypothetical protein